MDALVSEHPDLDVDNSRCGDVPLSQICRGNKDKLGYRIEDVLWLGDNYSIYRTERGVFVHFSDNSEESKGQRSRFAEIAPEICELRYLTRAMDRRATISGLHLIDNGKSEGTIFDHNVGQAIMLVMEDKVKVGKEIANSALAMAVARATNDNTIRYVRAALEVSVLVVFALIGLRYILPSLGLMHPEECLTASGFGAVGALFSISTRLQSFELKPCQESNMNYLVSVVRILMGSIAGLVLFLFLETPLADSLIKQNVFETSIGAAVVGFVGGFAERLVRTIAQQTARAMGDRVGTAVQAVRRAEQPSQ